MMKPMETPPKNTCIRFWILFQGTQRPTEIRPQSKPSSELFPHLKTKSLSDTSKEQKLHTHPKLNG